MSCCMGKLATAFSLGLFIIQGDYFGLTLPFVECFALGRAELAQQLGNMVGWIEVEVAATKIRS